MNVLVIVQGPAYGDERAFNGTRLVTALTKRDGTTVRMFLIGDAVTCAVSGQKVPDGYYHLDRMLEATARHGAEIGCCSTCMDARAITDEQLIAGARRSGMDELAHWVLRADKTVTF